MTVLHVVLPDGVDDPGRPSGGNAYDRHACLGLTSLGWTVHERQVPGSWPVPDEHARGAVADALADTPSGSLVLVDGLIASTVPEVLARARDRLRLVALVHMPLGAGTAGEAAPAHERAALEAVDAIVTTSQWTREWLINAYALPPTAVHAVPPGVVCPRARGRHIERRSAAVRRGGHAREGSRRAARRAGLVDRPAVALCLRRQPGGGSAVRRRDGGPCLAQRSR